ncbi:DapH/DapD/GlmU-related protein [Lactiplantibacillus plantarum]|uniref:DapH/DapD/GlmU-related protein n=1 Tax=Lactiplantibacillus plantarum TaxID=1590 RepID=UPI000A9D9AFE|nr:DapH/DapD/GlmU-related protein [Lactiplantibacillus plantarum]QLL38872.1 Putative acetyltransferase [Lactiplantibacillus plantarum]BEI51150.1 acetyltransferase [Lactiplantibacillus plantarum]
MNVTREPSEIRERLAEITGQTIDISVEIRVPLWTDYGRNLKIGKRVFINDNVQITDLGGIELADDVLIGPGAMLLSVNHPLDPAKRHAVEVQPIHIERNAWIGADAKVLAGVTVGENAVVGAGAVVTKSVPANTVVAGVPAKVIKTIEQVD